MSRGIGARLAHVRRVAGLSRQQVATCLGLTASALEAIERDRHPVSLPVLIRCADLFGVALNDLVDLTVPLPPIARLRRVSTLTPEDLTILAEARRVAQNLDELNTLVTPDGSVDYAVRR